MTLKLFSAPDPFVERSESAYGIGALASVECPLPEIARLRKELTPPRGAPFAASFLKPTDEQTVVGLAAVLRAIRTFGLEETDFSHWGVISAPRYLGRLQAAEVLYKFQKGGAWKAPPLFVPHHSLHALSGTISQALQIKGPNFGVGGGTNFVTEGLLSSLFLLDTQAVEGLWTVITQCDPEPDSDDQGKPTTEAVVCQAVALAFLPVSQGGTWGHLRLVDREPQSEATVKIHSQTDRQGVFSSLCRFLESGFGGEESWRCSLDWGSLLELTPDLPDETH